MEYYRAKYLGKTFSFFLGDDIRGIIQHGKEYMIEVRSEKEDGYMSIVAYNELGISASPQFDYWKGRTKSPKQDWEIIEKLE